MVSGSATQSTHIALTTNAQQQRRTHMAVGLCGGGQHELVDSVHSFRFRLYIQRGEDWRVAERRP